jgi:hypothetical protein
MVSSHPAFFAVSTTKLVVMSLSTFGLYQIYWFYRHWQYVRRRERASISPVWRSLLGVLFCYPLVRRIERFGKEQFSQGHDVMYPAARMIAATWTLTALLCYLPAPYHLASFGSVLFLVPAQETANSINRFVAPGHDRNSRFSAGNIATIVIGGLLFVISVIGILVGPQQA